MLKLAFLFLTVGPLYHQHLWQDFLEGNGDRCSLYVHSKNALSESDLLYSYRIQRTVPTSWTNTMRAQIELLKEALKDPANEKFIFISESTIPLASFDTVYARLFATPQSMFVYQKNPYLKKHPSAFDKLRNLKPILAHKQYKNPQWVVLNRKHAQLMVQDTYYISIISKCNCDNEHYPSTFLAGHGLLSEVKQQSTTFAYWSPSPAAAHPYVFVDFNKKEDFFWLTKAISQGYLFLRKVDKNCVLERLYHLLPYYK